MIPSMTAAAPSKPERPVLSPAQIEKIATSIVTAGLVAIVIKPFRDDLRVAIETQLAKQPPEAKTLWLLSTKAAERVLGEVFNSDERAHRGDGAGCRFKGATIDEIEALIVAAARLIDRPVIASDREVAAEIEACSRKIAARIANMKRSGGLKLFEQRYRAERLRRKAADEPGLPEYSHWLTSRLRNQFEILRGVA
jgi:arsenate reductase-like glutaredoxin family protein